MQNFSSGLPSDTRTQVGGLANNLAALLCYLPCTALLASIVWLVTEPKSNSFLRFHAIQSLLFGAVVTIVVIALSITMTIIQLVLATASGTLAAIVGLISTLFFLAFGLAVLVGLIMAMMKSYQGQLWKFPFVGELAEKYSR
jgi:uncharacterized membrane protein